MATNIGFIRILYRSHINIGGPTLEYIIRFKRIDFSQLKINDNSKFLVSE